MSVFLWKSKTTYVAVPKIACTSVKTMLFEVENDRPFLPFDANGKHFHIHNLYPTIPFDDLPRARIAEHARFALVRDPVERFLSAYANRVRHHRELSEAKAGPALAAHGLPPDPPLQLFVDRLDEYLAASASIAHHVAPMVDFLGDDPAYYDRLFALSRIDDFLSVLAQRLGRALSLPRLQTGGPKMDAKALGRAHLARLRQRYEADYAVFGGWL